MKDNEDIGIKNMKTSGQETALYTESDAWEKNKPTEYFTNKLLLTCPCIVYIFDIIDHKEIYSHNAAQLLGYTQEEWEHMKQTVLQSLHHPDDLPRVMAHFESFKDIKDDEISVFEYRLKDKTGNYRWFRNYETIYRRREAVPHFILGIAFDINDEKKFENEAKQREAQLLEAQEIANVGSFVYYATKDEVIATPQYYKIFELNKGFKRKDLFANVHPDDRKKAEEAMAYALNHGTVYDTQYRYNINDREKMIWAKGTLHRQGDEIIITGTVTDITSQYEMTRQLKESAELNKLSQQLSHIGNWKWDVQTGKMFWSEELYRILGLEPQSATPNADYYFSFIHPDDRILVEGHFQNVSAERKKQDFVHRVLLPSGVIKTVQCIAETETDGKEPMRLYGTIQDISDRITAEAALYRKNEELRRSNANLEEFAYIASHDLREPLRKISAFGNLLHDALHDKLQHNEAMYLDKMVESAKRMQTMIDDLLTLSRISVSNEFEIYSLEQIYENALQTLEHKIEQKKAVIKTDGLPEARIVPAQFRQLFQNLLDNSLKFSKDDVTPEINITHTILSPLEAEQLGLDTREEYLKLMFTDNGIGFDNEYADRIFGMFQRLHGRSEYEGSGIGLAICKKIAEHHKGMIFASGEEGKGATVTIIIPL